jgi:hypothetical protein
VQEFPIVAQADYLWKNIDVATGNETASGTATADEYARLTVPQFEISGTGNKLIITCDGTCPEPVSSKTGLKPVKDGIGLTVAPNPFSTSVDIFVRRPSSVARQEVRLEVFNIAGKMIANFKPRATSDERRGTSYNWSPRASPNGIYLVKVKIGQRVLTRKITLVK